MTKYRKKPVEIEAFQWRGCQTALQPKWFHEALKNQMIVIVSFEAKVHTLEGIMTASVGDWIIQGVKGEIYPCKPDIFEATYELV